MRGKFKPTIPQRSTHSSQSDSGSTDVLCADSEPVTPNQQLERGLNETGTASVASLVSEVRPSVANRRKRPVPNLAVAAAKRTKESPGQSRKDGEQTGESVTSEEVSQTSVESGYISQDQSLAPESEVSETAVRITDDEKTQCRKRSMSKCRELPSDRTNLKMCDLIYHNPRSNPMKKTSNDSSRRKTKSNVEKVPVETEVMQTDDDQDGDDDIDMVVPRVKVGADGSIVIDQESLILQPTRARLVDVPSDVDIQEDEGPLITSGSFRKHVSTKAWSKEETDRLYDALSKVGTDFSLMVGVFPGRTRKQIKAKFKREEKYSCARVNEAISKSIPLQESTFESLAGTAKSDRSEVATQ